MLVLYISILLSGIGCVRLTKIRPQASSCKLFGFSDRDLNIMSMLKIYLRFLHTAWCCQPECVAQCNLPNCTDRTGRYTENWVTSSLPSYHLTLPKQAGSIPYLKCSHIHSWLTVVYLLLYCFQVFIKCLSHS